LFRSIVTLAAVWAVLAPGTSARADVFDMGGTRNADGTWTGRASMETVPVGNLGNTGEWYYERSGDSGRSYGAVHYAYCISKYEVTAAQYTEFLNAVARISDSYGLYDTKMWSEYGSCKIQRKFKSGVYEYSAATNVANRPVNYVTWGNAARFANWLHNGQPATGVQDLSTTEDGAYWLHGATSYQDLRAVTRQADWQWAIPTEDEWYKAAYHCNDGDTGNYFDYPTSNNTEPSNDLTDPDDGNNANFYQNGHTIDTPGVSPGTTVVGDFEESESPYGTFDQGGNVWEWNEAKGGTASRGVRGGSWSSDSNELTASYRGDFGATYPTYFIGFRVVNVPEPGSVAMLLAGAVGLLTWRLRRNA
jgi:formylglycine-generating enzyme required for sulfatase activity